MKNIIFGIMSFTLLLSACGQSSRTTHKTEAKNTKNTHRVVSIPQFNADSAYHFVARQVAFGPRVPGTPAHDRCAKWMVNQLKTYTPQVVVQNFSARTYDHVMRQGKNIIASFSPEKTNRILLMAHWDSRPFADHDKDKSKWRTPIDAANDGASGVGVLMELARLFHRQNPQIGIDIVLFDLEDWGAPEDIRNQGKEDDWALGAQYWAKHPHTPGYSANFGILLDMVGAKNATFLKEYYSRQYARYYVKQIWNTAAALGYDNYFPNRDGYPIDDDHYYINKIAGIPSVDIIQLDPNSSNGTFWEYWHTTGDTMDKIDKNTLKAVGQVLLTVIYRN